MQAKASINLRNASKDRKHLSGPFSSLKEDIEAAKETSYSGSLSEKGSLTPSLPCIPEDGAEMTGCSCAHEKVLRSCLGDVARFLVSLRMQPTEEQLTALGNYRDIINLHLPEIAEGIGVPSKRLKGWMEHKGEPTSEQAQKILDFLTDKVGRGPQV